MKRRLRKKLYLEEFAVLGFEFSCKLNEGASLNSDAFFDALIDLISSRNLMIDGGGSVNEFAGYVSSDKRYGSATEEDIAALKAWLESLDGVEEIKVTGLTDVCYGV